MSSTLPSNAFGRRWIHSHEEDRGSQQVFRTSEFSFPPSRGRRGFELRTDGALITRGPGADDRTQESAGNWELMKDGTLRLRYDEGAEELFRLVSVTTDRLVLERSPAVPGG